MTFTAEQIELVRYALDYTGRFTDTGISIPRVHDKKGEELHTSIYSTINEVIQKEIDKRKKEKDKTNITEIDVTFSLEQRLFLLEMLAMPWEAKMFEKKNAIIALLNT